MLDIHALPQKAQELYNNVHTRTLQKYGDDLMASKVGWASVKARFDRTGSQWVAKGLGLDFFSFSTQLSSDVFINKGADGEYYLEATLSDVGVDTQGKRFTREALMGYAKQINEYGIAGFITHADWDHFKMENSHLSESEFIAKARNERKGILKTVRAVYEKGKLWIKALIDKRYLNRIKQFKKVSIEALVPKKYQVDNEYRGGYVLGFALDNRAINDRAHAQIV